MKLNLTGLGATLVLGCGGGGTGGDGGGSDTTAVGDDSTTAIVGESSTAEPATTAIDSSGSASTSSAADSSETAQPACEVSADCMAATPICDDGQCVACSDTADGDAACAERDSNAPACGADGTCVQCSVDQNQACQDTTPICDAASATCRACGAHQECELACEFETGECFTPEAEGGCVVDVPDNFVSLIGAISSIDPDTRCAIRLADIAGDDYFESVAIDQGKRLAILPQSGVVHVVGSAGNAFSISGGAQVYLEEIDVVDGGGGITVSGAGTVLHFDHGEIARNDTLDAVRVSQGAHLEMRNAVAVGEPFMAIGSNGVRIDAASTATLLNVAMVGLGTGGFALSCANDAVVEVRNSVVFTSSAIGNLFCDGATVTHTATENDIPGDGNLGGMLTADSFADFDGRDFRITGVAADALSGVGQWLTGDPTDDIDGQPRIGVDGETEPPGVNIP